MNCFRHTAQTAVGICRSCGKGLCLECAAEAANGLACKNSCEDRVSLINRILDTQARAAAVANTQIRSGGIYLLVVGLLFLVSAAWWYAEDRGSSVTLFFGVFGIVLTLFGVMRLFARRFPTSSER